MIGCRSRAFVNHNAEHVDRELIGIVKNNMVNRASIVNGNIAHGLHDAELLIIFRICLIRAHLGRYGCKLSGIQISRGFSKGLVGLLIIGCVKVAANDHRAIIFRRHRIYNLEQLCRLKRADFIVLCTQMCRDKHKSLAVRL